MSVDIYVSKADYYASDHPIQIRHYVFWLSVHLCVRTCIRTRALPCPGGGIVVLKFIDAFHCYKQNRIKWHCSFWRTLYGGLCAINGAK